MRIGVMKDSKTKSEESNSSHTRTQNTISTVIHTWIRQFHRGRQSLSGCVARTDAPVYIRERGGGRRGLCTLRNDISPVVHT